MKTLLAFLSLSLAFLLYRAYADESETNRWGPATNQVQITISLKGDQKEIKTNQPFVFHYQVQNLSTNQIFHFFSSTVPINNISFSFVLAAPSGKRSVLRVSSLATRLSQCGYTTIQPNGKTEFDYQLSDIFKPDEIGTYNITAKIWMSLVGSSNEFEVISAPLSLTVTPGKWVPPSTPASAPKNSAMQVEGGTILKGFNSTLKSNQ
jgi:hypothetical protein